MTAFESETWNDVEGAEAEAEERRLAILAEHDPDSLEDDAELKAITDFAAELCDANIALVSLVESERQRFIARRGLEAKETPRPQSFCQHAMRGDELYEVRDASADPAFADNPLVIGEPKVRFYAGMPIKSAEGAPLGALCVIDAAPRADGLDALQRQGMKVLADAVTRRLRQRRELRAATSAKAQVQQALEESEGRFEALADAIPQMAWSTLPSGHTDYFNMRWQEFTGAKPEEHYGAGWLSALHPDDSALADRVWSEAVASGEPYEVEYRLKRHDGVYRWTLARGLPMRDAGGKVVRWFGTNTDIHERKMLEESRDLLSRELSHRIKNIFSVVSGLISFETRERPELRELADTISARIAALGRAHDFVRPQGIDDEEERTLHGLLEELFAAYVQGDERRVRVSGEDPEICPTSTTPLALLFHELATNAVKYGALSNATGHVEVTVTRVEDEYEIDWQEVGGPEREVEDAPAPSFGHGLVDMAVIRQLKGTIERGWDDGFNAIVTIPAGVLQ